MNAYEISKKGDKISMKTPFFRAEKGSILHSGIYNRELASSLASGAVLVILYFLLRPKPSISLFISGILIFGLGTFIFRMFLFNEQILELDIDRAEGKIYISIKRVFRSKKLYPLSELKGVEKGHIIITPENPDGIRVVEKIALQHGTVIPGFGEKKEYYTIQLNIGGDKVVVFSSRLEKEADRLREELIKFLGLKYA